jgi:hypothetical protein
VHEVAERQDTPTNWLIFGPGFTVGAIDQLLPFQTSARVKSGGVELPVVPTAMHQPAVGQEVLVRSLK